MTRAALATWAGFVGLLVLVAARHELGHLDAHGWNLVRSAGSTGELLELLAPEGHPPLWFVLLRGLAAVAGPGSMQALAVALTALAAWLLLAGRAFPLPVAILALGSFYVLYQYAVVPRPYALVLPLLALSAHALRRGRPGFARHALLGAGVASTSAYGLLVSPAVLVAGLAAAARAGGRASARRDAAALGFVLGLGCYAAAAAATTWFVLSPGSASPYEARVAAGAAASVPKLHVALTSAAFPHLGQWPVLGPWLVGEPTGRLVAGAAAVAVLVAVGAWLHGRSRAAAGAWLAVVAAALGAAWFTGQVGERHVGHLALAALYLCWAHAHLPVRRRPRVVRLAGGVLVAALAGQAAVGAGVAALDLARPSAPSRAAAAAVERAAGGSPYELMVSYVLLAEAALAYLDVAAFDAYCLCWTRYPRHDVRYDGPPVGERVWERWCATRRHPQRQGFAILDLEADEADPARVELLETLPTGFRYADQLPSGVFRIRDDVCETA